MTFFLGGFITTAARLARSNIRPLLLPAPGYSPSVVKRIYDFLGGFLSLIIMNYTTVPFMLLAVKDSVEAWRTLGWYGLYIIFGGLAFFYLGGEGWLKGIQKRRAKEGTLYAEVKVNGKIYGKSAPPSGVSTPTAELGAYPPALEKVFPPN
jgi:lysophospholipid acyltransferase